MLVIILKLDWNSIVTKIGAIVINSIDLNPTDFVIPSEARDLYFATNYRSLASLGMTIHKTLLLARAPEANFSAICYTSGLAAIGNLRP
jgi:hypothetical protein